VSGKNAVKCSKYVVKYYVNYFRPNENHEILKHIVNPRAVCCQCLRLASSLYRFRIQFEWKPAGETNRLLQLPKCRC